MLVIIGTHVPCHMKGTSFFKKKLSLLCRFSATEGVSSMSFHKLKRSPESTYRAVVEVQLVLSTRGVILALPNQIFLKQKDAVMSYLSLYSYVVRLIARA